MRRAHWLFVPPLRILFPLLQTYLGGYRSRHEARLDLNQMSFSIYGKNLLGSCRDQFSNLTETEDPGDHRSSTHQRVSSIASARNISETRPRSPPSSRKGK